MIVVHFEEVNFINSVENNNMTQFSLIIQVLTSCIIMTLNIWCSDGLNDMQKWITIDMWNNRLQNFKPLKSVSKKLQAASTKSKLLCFWVAFLCISLLKRLLLRFQFVAWWNLGFITLPIFFFLHIVHCDSLKYRVQLWKEQKKQIEKHDNNGNQCH